MFFTNTGRVYVERVHEIPDMGRAAKGRSIANLLELKAGETIAALIRVLSKTNTNKEDVTWEQPGFVLFFATKQGTVKKTELKDFANVRKGGIIAIGIDPGDTLIDVKLTTGQNEAVLITRDGMSIRFNEHEMTGRFVRWAVPPPVCAASIWRKAMKSSRWPLWCRTPNCWSPAKTALANAPISRNTGSQSRGGKGIITMKTTEKTGAVVGALTVRDADEIMLITVKGQMVRTFVKDIREAGRNTQGVKLIELESGDKLQAIAPVIGEDKEDSAGEDEPAK